MGLLLALHGQRRIPDFTVLQILRADTGVTVETQQFLEANTRIGPAAVRGDGTSRSLPKTFLR